MTAHVVDLQPGSLVSFEGNNFVIEAIEDLYRVLARRLPDGTREFLRVTSLAPPVRAPSATGNDAQDLDNPADPTEGSDAEERPLPVWPPEAPSEATPEPGRWRKSLAKRQVRVVPSAHQQTERQRAALDEATEHFQAVARVLDFPPRTPERAAAVADLAAARGYSIATAFRYVAIVEENHCAEALLRSRRSDKGALRVSDKQVAVIRARFDTHRFIPEKHTMESVRVLVNGDLRAQGQKQVSLKTLYRLEQRFKTKRERLISEGRKEQVRNQFGSRAGTMPDVDFPLAIIEIDHTTIQVIFVDEEARKPLSDAWITLVIDCFSRMVLGYYLSFSPPSAVSAGIALARAFLPKDEHLAKVNVKGDWPCWGFPTVVVTDNAAELNGHMMQSAARSIRFDIRDRPVGMPHFGGAVESAFRTFMHLQRAVRGTKFSNPTERQEYDSTGRAMMTLSEFDQLFTEFLVNDYHLREHTGEGMNRRCPLQRWKAGLLEGDVMPPMGLPPIPANPEQLMIAMLPFDRRVVANTKVDIFNLTYSSSALAGLSDMVDPSWPVDDRKFEVRYDPRNIAVVWVRDPSDGHFIPAKVQRVSWDFRSLWEHEEFARRAGQPAAEFEDERYQSKLRQDQIQAEAAGKTKAARTKAARKRSEQRRRNEIEAITKPQAPRPGAPGRANPLLSRQDDDELDVTDSPRVRVNTGKPTR